MSFSFTPNFTQSLGFKIAILLLLLAQNTIHVLLIRYSRGERKEKYNKTTLVFLTEILKLCTIYVISYLFFSNLYYCNN